MRRRVAFGIRLSAIAIRFSNSRTAPPQAIPRVHRCDAAESPTAEWNFSEPRGNYAARRSASRHARSWPATTRWPRSTPRVAEMTVYCFCDSPGVRR